jgi:hypothetical protein
MVGVCRWISVTSGLSWSSQRRATSGARRGGCSSPSRRCRARCSTLIVMLASERTANVTGANYVIDGGLIKTT